MTETSCREVSLLLPWYVNATLPQGERETVTEHLLTCDECRRELDNTRRICKVIRNHRRRAKQGPGAGRLILQLLADLPCRGPVAAVLSVAFSAPEDLVLMWLPGAVRAYLRSQDAA